MYKILTIAHSEHGGGIQTVFRINNALTHERIRLYKGFEPDEYSKPDLSLKNSKSYKSSVKRLLANIFIPYNYFSIKKFLKANEIDIIHIHSTALLSISSLLAIRKHKGNAKVILTTHGYGLVCPNYSCFDYSKNKICHECVKNGNEFQVFLNKCDKRGRVFSLMRFFDFKLNKLISNNYKMYDKIITPSDYLKNLLLSSTHDFWDIQAISNPIDFKEDLNDLDKKKNIISYVGRFSEEKNVILLLEAFAYAKKKQPNIYLELIGAGPLKSLYKSRIDELNINENVFITSDFVDRETLSKHLKKSKVLVLPSSVAETFGLVIFEAVRLGVIPIAQNIGAQAENIKKINLGHLYKNEEIIDLGEYILESLDNYNSYQNQVKKANSIIDKEFSIKKYHENISELYMQIADQNIKNPNTRKIKK